MRPVVDLDRWLDALAYTHTRAFRAVVEPDEIEIPVEGGSATLDQTREIRGTADMTLTDDGTLGLVPAEVEDLLAPYGNLVRVERGIVYPDGTTERVSIGRFRIEDSDVDGEAGDLTITLSCQDRAAVIVDAAFERPGQIPAGTNFLDAIETVLADVIFDPELETDFAPTDLTTPAAVVWEDGDDRWTFLRGLATAIGAELFFDGAGVLVLRPVTSDLIPVMTLATGPGGVVKSPGRRWSRREAVNRVVVTGENTGGVPVRAEAYDDDDNSPTYYFGPFGKKTLLYSSQFVTTEDQAGDVAQSLLTQRIGTTRQAAFAMVPNPALEAGDVIRLIAPDVGIEFEDLVLDSITIPFSLGEVMSAETRAVRVVGEGS